MDFDLLDFYTAKKYIESAGITDLEIGQEAARLCGLVLDSEDITAAATLCLNSICRELLNIEQRQRAGYKSTHQQIMLGRWANLLEFVLKRLQGVKIKPEPGDAAVEYFANRGRVQYINPAENQPNPAENQPQEPSTDRAKKAFAAAVEAGFMEKTGTGYKWKYNRGNKRSLAYFLVKTYNPDKKSDTPFIALGKLFGVSRLDSHAYQVDEVKKEQKWRAKIDELLKGL